MKKGLFAVLAGISLLLAAPTANAQAGPTIASPSAGSLADGYITVPYNQAYVATGGAAPFVWSVTAGAVPTGLSLAAGTGLLSGTPTAAGNNSFDITVTDTNNDMDSASYTLDVFVLPAIGTPAPGALPAGSVSSPYSQTFTATGGKTAYTWSVSAGALPTSLSLNASTGVLSGTPTLAEIQAFDITVSDANGVTDTGSYTLEILAAPPNNPPTAPAPISPANGTTGVDGTSVTFQWNPSSDPDGDGVTYWLNLCTDASFSGCAPILASRAAAAGFLVAAIGGAGLLLLILAGGLTRPGVFSGIIGVALLAVLLSTCGGGGSGDGGAPGPTPLSTAATGLSPNTVYFWKITADDGNGGATDSAVWSFTTAP